jgi:hypothetical protein
LDAATLPEIGWAAEEGCTISAAIRGAVVIAVDLEAV